MSMEVDLFLFQVTAANPSAAVDHQTVSAAAHDFVRRHLAEACGRPPESLNFRRLPHGKPFLPDAPVCFNLSHCGRTVAAAFARTELGVDLEAVRPVRSGIAARFFTPEERRYLDESADESDRESRFFAVWTAKEAYLKRHGAGLAGGLHFTVANEAGLLPVIRSEAFPPCFLRHRELTFPSDADNRLFHLSLCTDRPATIRISIDF